MALQEEIDRARAEIRTDGYPVSIGEWISLYERHELDIHPEFQRFFRWSPKQKSRLIESILLGIPIPPIFVAQRSDGVWDVVDGLQRLSTILQFAGILRDELGTEIEPLTLESTKYLPSLGGHRWEDPENPEASLTMAQRLIIKRSKIDASIILRESDEKAKYELFQRLNTGGSPLSDQEVRNSILVMINRDLYRWMLGLAADPGFQECVALSDRALDEQYDMELVLRFLVFRTMPEPRLSTIGDMGEFLTDKAVELAELRHLDLATEEHAFRTTFQILQQQLSSDAFRRYDWQKLRFLGGFSVSAFEAVALGIGFNYQRVQASPAEIVAKAQQIWREPEFVDNSGSGIRASSRVPKILPFARRLFGE
ncbi:MAG TPA: DUF262 domain-containing protein [Longimicrobiaceae bacterium]|nr:DUF262 domain-containing protein [Longimicrobiaceae bacterium]